MKKFLILLMAAALLAACAAPAPTAAPPPAAIVQTVEVPVPVTVTPQPAAPVAKELVVSHWWTAGGERQAMDVIFEHFTAANPDIELLDNPVAGGGGITLKTVLQGLLAAKAPPDTFQTLSGSELKMYVDGKYVEPVDDIWTDRDLDTKYPEVIGSMVTFDGKHYAIPVSIHRANWLFYNVKLFNELGLKPPTDVDELIAVAKTIHDKKPDVAPIAIGTRDKWTAVFLFDVVLLSVGGPDKYEQFYTGQLDPATDPTIKTALEKYAQLAPYLYPFHGTKTWDGAIALLGTGEAGMMVIGDFGAAQLVNAGYKEGVDWEGAAFPTKPEEVYLMIIDCFVRPVGAPHPDSTTAWLNNLTDPETQAEFTIIKGSIAANLDVPASNYPDDLHQRASEAFQNLRVVPASAHGALTPQAFLSDWQDILTRFLYTGDIQQTISDAATFMESDDVAGQSAWYLAAK